jgi:hypothetical protein
MPGRTVTSTGALGESAQPRFGLHGDDASDRAGVVGEVEPAAGPDLDDLAVQPGEQLVSQLRHALALHPRTGRGVEAAEERVGPVVVCVGHRSP